MVYKINVPLVGGGTRKKEIIDANNNLTVDEIRAGSIAQAFLGFGANASHGYAAGGNPFSNVIQKYSFASDANATDVGDLIINRNRSSGQSSSTSGYASGGASPNPASPPPLVDTNAIEKWPFATDTNASDVGDLTESKQYPIGQSSTASGYVSGGFPNLNTIEKFPFSSDANGSDVGDLTVGRNEGGGQSSETDGYFSGGSVSGTSQNAIDKFPFSSDANATDVGDLTQARMRFAGGQSSDVSGYSSGGLPAFGQPNTNIIDKFPFSSDANATDVGDLTQARGYSSGTSSSSSGYAAGGFAPPEVNTIDKFPFSSDANATDVGDLLLSKTDTSGTQG